MLGITLKQTRVYQEAIEEGREEEAADGILHLLKKRFGQELSEEMRAGIKSLPLATLHNLREDLWDFTSLADLRPWLEAQ